MPNAHQRREAKHARRRARVSARASNPDREASRLRYHGRLLTRGVEAWDRMVKIAANPLPEKTT